MSRGKGWFLESRRHRLSALGIKTGRKLLPKKIRLNVLQGNPMFFPQSKEVLKIAELNYTATKLRLGGKTLDQAQLSQVAMELEQKLREKGYSVNIDTSSGKMIFKNIRLIPEVTGYNISQLGKRGRVLNWDDWVKVNNLVNKQLDTADISANVSSLGGKFVIRAGTEAKTEEDWEALSLENVGSVVSPITRKEAWRREQGYPKTKTDSLLEKQMKVHRELLNLPEYKESRMTPRRKGLEKEYSKLNDLIKIQLGKLNYTPKYKASDIGAVATDVVVGTGAEVKKYAPVIAVAKVRQWTKRKLKGKRKAKKKKSRKKGLFYSKSIEEKKLDKITKELVALTIERKKGKKKLNYPQAIKSKYPTVTKEITKLSLKHNLKKPILKYGKNNRLATFIPPNTIKLSKKPSFSSYHKYHLCLL